MKYTFTLLLLFISYTATAGCIGPVIMGNCEGTITNYSNSSDADNYDYEYDLRNTGDRIRYGNDSGAQTRDNNSVDIMNDVRCSTGGFCGGGKY